MSIAPSADHSTESALGLTLSFARSPGDVTSLAAGGSPWLPGVPVLLVAGRFGEDAGLAWWSTGAAEASASRSFVQVM